MKIEIKNAPSSEIDWSKFNQLVISEDDVVVVLAESLKTGKTIKQSDYFAGIKLKDMSYSDSWLKSVFEPFNGEITLKND